LPRTPLPRSSRLYCFRMVEYRASALFVDSALGAGRSASTDDSHKTSAFRVTHDEEAALLGKSKCEETTLTFGMIGIVESDGQRITKDGGRLLKRDFVVMQIRGGLLRIPTRTPYAYSTRDVFSLRLTTELSGRPQRPCRGKTRPTMIHGRLERVVRQHDCPPARSVPHLSDLARRQDNGESGGHAHAFATAPLPAQYLPRY
jgi:hypothetical protein